MKRILLSMLLVATAVFADTTVTLKTMTFTDDAVDAWYRWSKKQVASQPTLVASNVNNAVTTLPVGDSSGIALYSFIVVDDEVMYVSAKTTGSLTVIRAQYNTTAAAHSADAVVKVLKYTTFNYWCNQVVVEQVQAIYTVVGDPTNAAAIATAQASTATKIATAAAINP